MNGNSISLIINKSEQSQDDIALIYYKIIAAVYNIKLTKLEMATLVHTAVKGTISSSTARNTFVEKYKYAADSLNNAISTLQRKELLVKGKDLKIRVRPEIMLMFDKNEYKFNINVKLDELS